MKVYNPRSIAPPNGPYSHGIEMPPNCRVLWLAGQTGMGPDGRSSESFEEQCVQVFENIQAILAEAGMRMTDVVKFMALVTKHEYLPKLREIRSRYTGDHKPASTTFVVPSLVRPEWLVEIEAIAMKPVATARKAVKRTTAKRAAKRRRHR